MPAVATNGSANLTRERIVAAGVDLADRYGLQAVSIRRIAAELGSSPMALYHYVPSKRELLNSILDAANADFLPWPTATEDWRSLLSHFARESRRTLKLHPWTSALRADDPEYGPRCIEILEALLSKLDGFGLDLRTATRALGVLFVFVNGFVAAEAGTTTARTSTHRRKRSHPPNFSRAVMASGQYPHVERFLKAEAELPDDDGFERALRWILDGIEGELQTAAASGDKKEHRGRQAHSA